MGQATLPVEREKKLIRDLEQGESCWTVPWAIVADHDRCLWLDMQFPKHDRQGGTFQILVTHTHDGRWIAKCHDRGFTWSVGGVVNKQWHVPLDELT